MHLSGVALALCVVVLFAGSDAFLPGAAPTLDTHPGNEAEQMVVHLSRLIAVSRNCSPSC